MALIRHQYLKYDEMRRTTTGVSEVNAEAHKVAQHVPRLVAHIYALETELEALRRPRRVVDLPANFAVDEAIDPYDEDDD